jgi:ketosteroid isomerase-like protein
MLRFMLGVWLAICVPAAATAAGGDSAQTAVVATITRMTEAVDRGDLPTAYAAFIASPSIVEDGAPFRWQGEGAAKAWIDSMGANAQAQGLKGINMRLGAPSRIETSGDRAYAIVPGRLTYTMKDGHSEHADGSLTFTLQGAGGDWKIESMVWTGPVAKR